MMDRTEDISIDYRAGKIYLNGPTVHATIEISVLQLMSVYNGQRGVGTMHMRLDEPERLVPRRVGNWQGAPLQIMDTGQPTMWERIKRWLGIAQKETSEAFEAGEQVIRKAGTKVGEVVEKAGDKIQDAMKPVDELGAKYGGKGNPKGMGKDLK